MSLPCRSLSTVPDETARVARRAFRRGNPYLRLRDALGPIFEDAAFVPLYGHAGPPATSPARLALVTLMQYAEDLTDEQAADAVRSRVDWKYLLGLELEDAGFDASVLSAFRTRLVAAGQEALLFTRLLAVVQEQGLLRARGRQRTDSTHVLGAVARLNRLELVGETLRHSLNAVAVLDPAWLLGHADPVWVERYGPRLVARRLPKKEVEREALLLQIGRDGQTLLAAIDQPTTPASVQSCPAVATLRTVWVQHYTQDDDGLHPLPVEQLPPAADLLSSPYDPDVRTSQKRETLWTGYKVHLTETCDAEAPHLITHVETTTATVPDCSMLSSVQGALVATGRPPASHLVDAGYATAPTRVAGAQQGITVVAPVPADASWQARSGGYQQDAFAIDWDQEQATCPEGKTSRSWRPTTRDGLPVIQIHFRAAECQPCPARSRCTHADRRSLTVPPREQYEVQRQARALQQTEAFATEYAHRAGVEGTISQGVRRCDLRHARYRGRAKTRLQHQLIAAALNLVRVADWLAETVPSTTRQPAFVRVLAPAT
jgi:transposase